ncbi:MAG: NYN domain-containing protein [Planctomycetaceae bacterium]|nr:NYN domain-containing protein [Planctomycetaceae bacterium]
MHVARFDLLIDGYNLLHAAGFARDQYGPRGLEQQRERFVDWLWKRIPPNLRERTVVVFDAGATDAAYVHQDTYRELRLLYSPRGVEADDLIEELIELHSAPKQLQVVSSDHRLHKAARKRKATCLDSEAFLSVMGRIAREARERQRELEELSKPTGELAEETAEWLQVFAEADDWLAGVEPLPNSPDTRAQPQPSANAGEMQTDEAAPIPEQVRRPPEIAADELAFWEERLRDLLGS